MKSLNGNLLCAIDTETTGLQAGWNEITEIAIVPLDFEVRPMSDRVTNLFPALKPFTAEIKPIRLDRIDSPHLTAERLDHLLAHGLEAGEAFDLFEKWYAGLELAKQITPLGHNYAFDRGFLEAWMGTRCYQLRFDYHNRDSQAVATFLNDAAKGELPFPFTNLRGCCEVLGVTNDRAHSALSDALACAECYRLMLVRAEIA